VRGTKPRQVSCSFVGEIADDRIFLHPEDSDGIESGTYIPIDELMFAVLIVFEPSSSNLLKAGFIGNSE
jgi:hypothetical protein